MKNYRDGGEAILEAFRQLGIDYIMSSPGSEWGPVWEALARQKFNNAAGPTFLDFWHETTAVNVAAGYTLMTGRPQAVLLHAGVGLLQGGMGIYGALHMEIPMLVMSGESATVGENPDLDVEQQWYGNLSVGGAERFVEAVCKWARPITSPFTLYEGVIRAGEMAQRVPLGPVYLNVALEHMLHEWTPPPNGHTVPAAPKVQALTADIARVADELRRAANPMVVVENSGRDPAAFAALVELADLLALPVIAGRSGVYASFPTDHPLYLGAATYQHLKDADLVLLVGGRAPWYPPHRCPTEGRIIGIHENPLKPQMIYQNLHVDAYLEGDVATSLRLLAEAARATGFDAKAVEARRARWRREHDDLVARTRAAQQKARANGHVEAVALLGALAETMPREAIYVDETVTHAPLLRQHLPLTMPQSFVRGSGGLGQSLGLALGIKLAAPERPVVVLVGDGSFLYNPIVQGLGASKQHRLPLIIVVFNNGGYLAMKQGHDHHYADGAANTTGDYYGVNIAGPNYEDLGSHFGFHGERVDAPKKLNGALQNALAAAQGGRTAILNVVLGR